MFLFETQDATNFRIFLNFIEEYFLNPTNIAIDVKDFDQKKKLRDEYGKIDQ